jgi:hypothetical protein
VEPYSGEICTDVFISLQTCFSGDTTPPPPLNIPVSPTVSQEMAELEAVRLFSGLPILRPTRECEEAILPFLCLSMFGLCDTSDVFHTILRGQCLELRDNICADVWRGAIAILGPDALPVCEELADISDDCVGKYRISHRGQGRIGAIKFDNIRCTISL